jgi:hypothetical protein
MKPPKDEELHNKKCKIALSLINQIMINMDKDEIDTLINFKDIDRNDIIDVKNKTTLEDMQKELFTYFDKRDFGWYRRKKTKNYILTFLRYMCNDINFEFKYQEIKKQNDGQVTSYMLYSIKNKTI